MIKTRDNLYADELASLIRVETVTTDADNGQGKFEVFRALLRATFPAIFAACEYEKRRNSILLRWPGKDPALPPIMLMNHHDVVEASGEWTYPPFDGVVADGKVWGRGTLDTKGGLWAMLRAANELAKEGFVPERDIYFESASNEETSGTGASEIVNVLKERGIHFESVFDEGGMIMYDPIGGADGTFALVGMAEKGCSDLKFTARSNGGHASMPGRNTPLVRLGKFMAEADKGRIFKKEISPVTKEMFTRLAPYMKGPLKFIYGHMAFFAPIIKNLMPRISPSAGAMVSTTIAFTMSEGSGGLNVLPREAWVTGNMRFSHHQGGEASRRAITDLAAKYGVETEVLDPGVDSGLTTCDSMAFRRVEAAVSAVFDNVETLPYICTAASDSRFFTEISDGVVRFLPFKISDEQLDGIHGIDENVDVSCLVPAVEFYKNIIKGA